MHTPEAVPDEWPALVVQQIRAKNVKSLVQLWKDCEFLVDTPEERFRARAPKKLQFAKLKDFWGKFCVVVAKNDSHACTCPHFAQIGHCVHAYVVAELIGSNVRLGNVWPAPRMGAAQLRAEQRRRVAEAYADSLDGH